MKFHEIFKKNNYLIFRLRPTTEWRTNFHAYLRTMPAYYAAPLRRVLTRMGAGNLANSLIPETMDNCLSYRYENIKFYGFFNTRKVTSISSKNDYLYILNYLQCDELLEKTEKSSEIRV